MFLEERAELRGDLHDFAGIGETQTCVRLAVNATTSGEKTSFD